MNINDFEFLGIPLNLLSDNFSLLFLKNKCINTVKATMHNTKKKKKCISKLYIFQFRFMSKYMPGFGLCQIVVFLFLLQKIISLEIISKYLKF